MECGAIPPLLIFCFFVLGIKLAYAATQQVD